jgi:hypothetical protein
MEGVEDAAAIVVRTVTVPIGPLSPTDSVARRGALVGLAN